MYAITPVPCAPEHPDHEAARGLFREYGQFLHRKQACGGTFQFERFAEEIRTLPDCYTGPGGDVLLARIDQAPSGIIAYRQAARNEPKTCEIKRLFVLEAARGQGLARALLAEVMQRAATRGFTRAILDSDLSTMQPAIALYRSLGFEEYGERQGNLAYFERILD